MYIYTHDTNSQIYIFILYTHLHVCRHIYIYMCETVEYINCTSAEEYNPPPNMCSGYDIKHSDSEVLVMQEIWGIRSTPLLLSLPGPLWFIVVAPDRVLCMGQIKLNCILMLNWIIWNKIIFTFNSVYCPISWGCRIHRLHLCRGVKKARSIQDMALNNLVVRFQ